MNPLRSVGARLGLALAVVVAGGRALHEKFVSLLLWEEYSFVVLTHLTRLWEEEEV